MIAEKRLHASILKLRKENLYESCEKVFDDWLQAGIIEEVPNTSDFDNEYFLPHRHVVKASSNNSPSLNQCLETGPNLIELIPSIIIRFRENKIRVISDITKAYFTNLCSSR